MANFLVRRRLSLGFLGVEWKECYLSFNSLSYGELYKVSSLKTDPTDPKSVKVSMDQTLALLQEKFIDGKGLSTDGKIIDITKDDLVNLPVEVINKAVLFLVGEEVSPNSLGR